ncbi:MAG: hypothetical protein HYX86_01755 [Chloroflexi bacterium]|nr:hypothetical protein [Chloroflexota bacterium]
MAGGWYNALGEEAEGEAFAVLGGGDSWLRIGALPPPTPTRTPSSHLHCYSNRDSYSHSNQRTDSSAQTRTAGADNPGDPVLLIATL